MKLSDAVYGHRHGAAGLRPLVPLANHTRSQGFGFHPVTKSVVFDTQNFGGLSECSLQYNASDSAKKGITRLALNSPIAQMRGSCSSGFHGRQISTTACEAGGAINGHYGRDPIVKIYTTITDRYAPLHQKVIAGTAGEAIHALDGILGHESSEYQRTSCRCRRRL
nr:Tn3 family transposase [Rhizobium rhizolycopersici]